MALKLHLNKYLSIIVFSGKIRQWLNTYLEDIQTLRKSRCTTGQVIKFIHDMQSYKFYKLSEQINKWSNRFRRFYCRVIFVIPILEKLILTRKKNLKEKSWTWRLRCNQFEIFMALILNSLWQFLRILWQFLRNFIFENASFSWA